MAQRQADGSFARRPLQLRTTPRLARSTATAARSRVLPRRSLRLLGVPPAPKGPPAPEGRPAPEGPLTPEPASAPEGPSAPEVTIPVHKEALPASPDVDQSDTESRASDFEGVAFSGYHTSESDSDDGLPPLWDDAPFFT